MQIRECWSLTDGHAMTLDGQVGIDETYIVVAGIPAGLWPVGPCQRIADLVGYPLYDRIARTFNAKVRGEEMPPKWAAFYIDHDAIQPDRCAVRCGW